MPMPTPRPRHLPARPRHLPARPRHLPTARWPWRLGLVALGLTTAVRAALVASATLLSPQPPPPRRGTRSCAADHAGRADTKTRTDASSGPQESTTTPTRSTPTQRP